MATTTDTWAHRITEDQIILGDGIRQYTITSVPGLKSESENPRGAGRSQRSQRHERQWSDPTARKALHISQRRERSLVYSIG